MTVFSDQRILPYAPEAIFNVVADVDSYASFLPWCTGVRVTRREESLLHADLLVGFRSFRGKFSSHVSLIKPDKITVTYVDGPFRYLENEWSFIAHPNGTQVDFYISFEFRNRALQLLIGRMFDEAVQKMVQAFEDRAHQLYGLETSSQTTTQSL